MRIEFKETTITLDPCEAIDLYYALKRDVQRAIREHWVNHPTVFATNASRELRMLEILNRSVGHDSDVRRELLAELDTAVANKGAK